VCLLDSPTKCATTDYSGNFSLSGVSAQKSGLVATINGWTPGVFPLSPTGTTTWTLPLWKAAQVTSYAATIGTTFGPATGAIQFEALDGSGKPLAGVKVSVPGAGSAGYFEADGTTLNPTLTTTTSKGTGILFGVNAGNTIAVTFSAPGRTCTRNGTEGWPPVGTETTSVTVVANELTRASAQCQ
jgi:hypothetical protein